MGGELDPRDVQDVARRATAAVARNTLGGDVENALDPDRLLDRLLPGAVDWRGAVQRFPVASMLVAAAAGFLAGRSRGDAVVAGVASGLRVAAHELFSNFSGGPAAGPQAAEAVAGTGSDEDGRPTMGWWP
jgi:hypothetical protein